MLIEGSYFPPSVSKVLIGGIAAKILSSNASQIAILSPKLAPGTYQLTIPAGAIGNVK